MTDCCAAANCDYQRGDSENSPPLFSFPLDLERCKQWLHNCHRPDLASEPPEQLHSQYKLCAKHFEPAVISYQSASSCVLRDDAVPTIFDSPVNNQSTCNRKRARDPSEEETGYVKKSKENTAATEVSEERIDNPEDNTELHELQTENQTPEDVASSKAKETLKVYFKEILALTGFSINGSNITNEPISGSRGQQALNRICVEKIEKKEILQFSEDLMREEIQNSLRQARFFSILLQDVTRIEGKDQIPVFVRSVTVDGFPQKHLIGFLPCDMDADNLFYVLLAELRNKWGLRMEHCRGLSYLVTGNMCQKMRDLTSKILQEFPQVVLSPSDPYAFNIWIIRCMPVPSIQNVANTVEEVASLLRRTPELWKRLEGKIQMTYGHIKGEVDRIKAAVSENWEYGTDAFQTMLDILEPFLNCINEMISKVDEDTAEQMAKLKPVLKNFNFIITLIALKNTLCCVSILNSSLRGIISISSTLQYTISNALKLVSKYQQELAIFHRKWFSDAVGRAKKLGVEVTKPEVDQGNATETPLEDFYRETLSRPILQYLVAEVKRVFSTEMVRILRWLSLVPSYMADHNFSIRRDKVADANLNNLARPDTFYEELGCWEVKWKHASKRRILPTTVFATLKIPDIGFYPNVQSLLRVLGTVPCVNAEADVYGQYHMVLERCHSYLKATPEDQRKCSMAYVYVNQDVHFNVEQIVDSYVQKHPDILKLLQTDDDTKEKQSRGASHANHAEKDTEEELQFINLEMDAERLVELKCAETDRDALKSALQTAVTSAYSSHSRPQGDASAQEGEVEYVTKSEMKEVLTVCEKAVREGILLEVGTSLFSLFIDRVVKFGEKDYLPLFLRFVDSFDVMRLELMGFLEADLDCDDMGQRLLEIVTVEWNLDLNNCRGQAYLGSGDVSYKLKAFACKVQETHPLAISTHCSCYSFNTWWSKSIPVPAIKRALDTFEEVLMFFGSSATLQKQLDHVIAFGLRESYEKVQELQGKFCALWQENHDSYEVFVQMLEPLVECLEKIKNNPQRWKAFVSDQAGALLRKVMEFDFIIAMVVLKNASSFTKELSAGLQKDHFTAASQLCQIAGIVATLNRVKTNMKVFHQNWFDEACAMAQSLRVQIEVPDSCQNAMPRDGMMKPVGFYKDGLSVPLVDNLINAVKDHFSEDHKEALNFLSLVPCSVTVSYMFESLKSKPPLYSRDLPDADNFFTELCCWRVTWKTKVASVTVPGSIFHTLRLPLMQYFGNINALLRIMSVLPSTALEDCGGHGLQQRPGPHGDPVSEGYSQALEGICLDKESKSLIRNSENNMEVDCVKEETEEPIIEQSLDKIEDQEIKTADENGHSGDNQEDREHFIQELSLCHWFGNESKCTPSIGDDEMVNLLINGIRDVILKEIQESPFFSLITDKPVRIADKTHLPVFISESCGLAHWLAGSVPCPSVARMLDITEDLLLFFDESPLLEEQLAQAVDGLLNMPREALDEFPETCCSRWKKREDFFDLLADTLEGVLTCLDAVSSSATGAKSMHAQVLSTALRNMDFIVTLVILKNACAPLRNCSTVFRCGNPADILCEVEKIPSIIDTLDKMLVNVSTLHSTWFEQAFQLAIKVAPEHVYFSEEANSYESPEIYYRENLSVPLLGSLIHDMKYSFSDSHLKALSVLSLLPSCNPQPIPPESTDKPFSLYLADVSDPEAAEQEINAWAAVWSEKYQDAAPPSSIAETLVHPESKSHPTVTSLLRLVAVLPSVSMEWDLMKTTLNSMRDLLKSTVCKGSRVDHVVLLSHCTTLQRLPEVIEKCIEVDPESSPCLSQVMGTLQRLKLDNGGIKAAAPTDASILPQDPADGEVTSADGHIILEVAQGPRKAVSFYEPQLREQILKELWDSQFFTFITEQAVEIDGEIYVPLCIRYLNKEDIQCEETLAFIPFGEDPVVVADSIEAVLSEKWGLNMEYCRGQALLSVGEAGAQMRAVSLAIAKKYPQAVRTVSSALSLNVWLAKSSPPEEAADGAVLISKILYWLTEDVERQNKLEDVILHVFQQDEVKGNELRDKLIKNWDKSHVMHEVMVDILEAVMLCLNELKGEGSASDQQQASQFFDAVRNFEFILSTVVQKNILSVTTKLSQSLQGKPLDMLHAVNNLSDLKASLSQLKSDIATHHKAWFEEATALASKLHVTMLHSVLLEPLSEFYKESISMKLVEHSIAEIDDLFTEKVLDTLKCLEIVPYAMSKVETNILSGLVFRLYKDDLPDQVSLQSEMKLWKEKWLDPLAGYLPTTVLDTLKTSQIRSFSNIETLLRLQVILPFSRRESNFRQGKRSLPEFILQEKRSLTELHPL
ncbi:52 kDa repressor of the inhibitor of the protein kinase [Dissostichus eleginoides]|uniref:52 kDa repressor of the inhibitor of the protein kinase n=1 Tax=Dissostichus eleginoides TaxID=100907 RepID=A0AAD9BFH5_DISEL|nr:52 kDa repressor of the inhibitor of the protein kinase [Dissostichus eleginoides]